MGETLFCPKGDEYGPGCNVHHGHVPHCPRFNPVDPKARAHFPIECGLPAPQPANVVVTPVVDVPVPPSSPRAIAAPATARRSELRELALRIYFADNLDRDAERAVKDARYLLDNTREEDEAISDERSGTGT